MITSGGFFSNSFYPFLPWQQKRHRRSTSEITRSQSIENNPELILKMRLAKGEISPEVYSHLRKLISK
jgi:uncharacterized membrane protein